MPQLRSVALTFLVASSISLSPQEAQAVDWTIKDNAVSNRPHQLDVVGFIWPFGPKTAFGGAIWYGIPILPKGFAPPWNDSFYIEAGVVTSMYSDTKLVGDPGYFALVPMGGVRWNVHLTRDWTVFVAAKIGWLLASSRIGNSLAISATVGGYWHFSRDLWLRLETGNLGVAQAGISIPL